MRGEGGVGERGLGGGGVPLTLCLRVEGAAVVRLFSRFLPLVHVHSAKQRHLVSIALTIALAVADLKYRFI